MLQLKKSLNLSSLALPFRQALGVAARLGVSAVEINARTEIKPHELSQTGLRQIRKWLADYNLQVSCVAYPTSRGYENPEAIEQRLEGTKAAMRLAHDLGCRVVSNRLGLLPEDRGDPRREQLQVVLHDLANYGLKAGAWFAIRTGTVGGQSLKDFLQEFPTGSLGVDFDPAELLIYRHSPTESLQAVGEYVTHFRIRDAVRDLQSGITQEVQLGRGSIDLPALLGTLEEHHYHGYLSIDRTPSPSSQLECQQALEYLEQLFS